MGASGLFCLNRRIDGALLREWQRDQQFVGTSDEGLANDDAVSQFPQDS